MQLRAGFTGDETGTIKHRVGEPGFKEFFFPGSVADFTQVQVWRRRKTA
jgi:hypothetical protein